MTIRPATADDIEAVLPLVARIAAFHEERDPARYCYRPDIADRYRRWLRERAADDQSVFLVAQRDVADGSGPIVGFLVATTEREISIYRVERFGFIHDLWVEGAYRHEGLGRQLATLAIERFTQIGVQQIRLDVLVDNQPAIELFRACGFRPSTVMMLYQV